MVALSEQDYAELAQKAAGNHRRFESFGWHDRPRDSERWTIVYTHNRDSGLLEQSNAEAIGKAMKPFVARGTAREEHHGHWACGWVDGYSILVYTKSGKITRAFKTWCDLQESLANYPVLDEEDHSRREYEATLENIESELRGVNSEDNFDLPEDAASQLFTWLWNNNQREVENRDGHGGYPSEKALTAACDALGWRLYFIVRYSEVGEVVEEYAEEWEAEERVKELKQAGYLGVTMAQETPASADN